MERRASPPVELQCDYAALGYPISPVEAVRKRHESIALDFQTLTGDPDHCAPRPKYEIKKRTILAR
jgi:hypothetical protein